MRTKTVHSDFRSGLQTTTPQQSPGAAAFQEFLDGRVSNGACQRRPGMVRVAYIAPANGPYCADMDGTDDKVTITYDSRIWALHTLPEWTLEGLVQETDLSDVRPIFARNTGTSNQRNVYVYRDSTSGGRIVAELRDSSNNLTTLAVTGIAAASLVAWQLIKATDGTFTLKANGSSASGTLTTGTLYANTDDILLGTLNGGTKWFLGKYDYLRLIAFARTSQQDNWTRLVNPFARYVMADYPMEKDTVNDIQDRSLFNNHAVVSGSMATNVASIAVNPVPVQAICGNLTADNVRQVVVVAGGRQYEGTIR